jgi:hypothetical protein
LTNRVQATLSSSPMVFTPAAVDPSWACYLNRVAIQKSIQVESVNGPGVTIIQGARANDTFLVGGQASRCVHLGDNAVLSGFTLTEGHTRTDFLNSNDASGGGAWCAVSAILTNCLIIENSCGSYLVSDTNSGGGRVYGGILKNCTFRANRTYAAGRGAYRSTLENCLVASNACNSISAGVAYGVLLNCVVTAITPEIPKTDTVGRFLRVKKPPPDAILLPSGLIARAKTQPFVSS